MKTTIPVVIHVPTVKSWVTTRKTVLIIKNVTFVIQRGMKLQDTDASIVQAEDIQARPVLKSVNIVPRCIKLRTINALTAVAEDMAHATVMVKKQNNCISI